MNGGPTVRRLHREREERRQLQGYGARRAFRLLGRRAGMATATPPEPGEFAGQFVCLGTTRRPSAPVAPVESQRPAFPLRMGGVLGVGTRQGVIVIDGRLGHLQRHKQSSTDIPVAYGGVQQYVRFDSTVERRLGEALEARWTSLRQWCRHAGEQRYAELDALQGTPPVIALDRIDGFVNERLIPFIDAYVDNEVESTSAPDQALPVAAVVERVMPALDGSFAFVAGRWLRLIPFFGNPRPGQPLLEVGTEQLIGIQSQPASTALNGYDTALREAVSAACAGATEDGADDGSRQDTHSECDLYRRDPYGIIRTPRGRYFVTQRQPPYVVEGMDKKLYYFDGAEIGIQITSTRVKGVITSACVQVLHSYRHMFVGSLGVGNFICMPRDYPYYQDLYRQPLERALLEHLESGRMTLCAGYQPVNASIHRIQTVGRKTIGLAEVRRRNLPVYWFNEPRRKVSSKVMSTFV